jgi:hypothetical protein
MTFRQNLNIWCKEVELRVRKIEEKVSQLEATHKLMLVMLGINMSMLGVLIAAMFHVII